VASAGAKGFEAFNINGVKGWIEMHGSLDFELFITARSSKRKERANNNP
jgi:hypothetical protein